MLNDKCKMIKEKEGCIISKQMAYVICRGADCLPPQEPCVDVVTHLECEARIKENAVDTCKPQCESKCTTQCRLSATSLRRKICLQACLEPYLKRCVKERYNVAYPECYDDGDSVPLEERLSIMDPGSEYYMDIDDDLVMSVFGSVIRSPMEK